VLAPLAAGIDVVVRRRSVTGQDSRGNDVFTVTDVTYSGCAFWPGSAGRNVAGSRLVGEVDFRNSVVTRGQITLPPGAACGPQDLMQTPDGTWWRVVGEGQQWTSQLTGAQTGIEFGVERVDG
jgi:hypothetical protein